MSGADTTVGDDLTIPVFLSRPAPEASKELTTMPDATPPIAETIDPKGLKLFQAIALCDSGQVVDAVNQSWDELLRTLIQLDHHEGVRKSKGQLTLKIGVDYEDGTARLKIEQILKVPKAPQRASVFWLTGDGRLTPENPRQMTMFRDAPRRQTHIVDP